jgi:multimeric flavodoxin WrbA
MKALILNCSLKSGPEPSNTAALAAVVAEALGKRGVEVSEIRLADRAIPPGVETEMGEGDEWPEIHDRVLDSEILIFATPTWIGRPSSIAQRALERMDAMIAETDDEERPVAYNRVAGVVVTGNEDGAHHVISEICGALGDIGFAIPGQAWTYWNKGPGPGEDYSDTEAGHEWSAATGKAAASNLFALAGALAANPVPPPPSE